MSFCSWAIILAVKKNLKTLYDQMRALNDLSCRKLVLLFLRLNFNVSSLVSGKTEILGNGNVMHCFNIIASLTVECGYVIRS